MQHWEDAAAGVLDEIYALELQPLDVSHLRNHLNGLIDSYWNSAVGDSAAVRAGWIYLGAMARSMGEEMGFGIFAMGPGPVHDIVCRKQRDYGHKNISRFGRQGLMVRMHDKIARLENLMTAGARPNNESIEDNVVDVIGYSCIGTMWEDKTFLYACNTPTVAERPGNAASTAAMSDVLAKNGLSSGF